MLYRTCIIYRTLIGILKKLVFVLRVDKIFKANSQVVVNINRGRVKRGKHLLTILWPMTLWYKKNKALLIMKSFINLFCIIFNGHANEIVSNTLWWFFFFGLLIYYDNQQTWFVLIYYI